MTDDIDEIVQAIREKAWATSDADLAHGAADALERLKAERDKWYETFKSEMVDCAEWKAQAEAAEKERDGRKLECDELIKVCRDAEARAEEAEAEVARLNEALLEQRNILGEP